MGDSKRPIYAYVDETGNTGHNLFDEAQPDFYTAALVSKGDFDGRFGERLKGIAAAVGANALHGRELGVARLELVAREIVKLLVEADAHFFVSRVEKRYLLATKLFDSLFDSGETAAVAWHHYNVRPLRLMLAFKLAMIVDLETAKLFWQCIIEPNEKRAYELLPKVCEGLIARVKDVPDATSGKVILEGLEWARTHPESIQIHVDKKSARQGHFPNLVAFTNLLAGLDHFSKLWKKSVAKITHDEQSEFESALAATHDLLSNASAEELKWAGETHVFQKVAGSTFKVVTDSDSAGIQIADVVLWLYSQMTKGRKLPKGCLILLDYALTHAWLSDFSFDGVNEQLTATWGEVFDEPLAPEKEAEAKELLSKFEARRIASMEQYELDKLPPFMRAAENRISNLSR